MTQGLLVCGNNDFIFAQWRLFGFADVWQLRVYQHAKDRVARMALIFPLPKSFR
jgi:hypothetical protein